MEETVISISNPEVVIAQNSGDEIVNVAEVQREKETENQFDSQHGGEGDALTAQASLPDAGTGIVTAEFRTFTCGTIWKATATNLAAVIKKQGKKKTKNKGNNKDKNAVVVVDFHSNANVEQKRIKIFIPVIFEVFRTQSAAYLGFRAISCEYYLSNSTKQELTNLLERLRSCIMAVTILDSQCKIIQQEKLAFCEEAEGNKFIFEIEEFITISDLEVILDVHSALNICVTFVNSKITPGPVHEPDSLAAETESLERPGVKLPVVFKDFFIHDAFSSELGTRVLNPKFMDGVLRLICKDNVKVDLPIFRVLVAAQSTILGNKLAEGNNPVIIEGFEEEPVRKFLDYCYCGEVYSSDIPLLISLHKFADKFEVYCLKEKCLRNIHSVILRERKGFKQLAIEFYRVGRQLKAPAFTCLALDYYLKLKKSGNKGRRASTKASIICNRNRYGHISTPDDSYDDVRALNCLETLNVRAIAKVEEYEASSKTQDQRIIGAFLELTSGLMFLLPSEALQNMWKHTTEDEFGSNDEKVFLELKATIVTEIEDFLLRTSYACTGNLRLYKQKGSNDVHLRFDESEDRRSLYQDSDETTPRTLPPQSPNIEHFRVPVIKVAICMTSGKIVHEARCLSYSRGSDSTANIWESSPYITADEFDKFENLKCLPDGQDLVLRISLICAMNEPYKTKKPADQNKLLTEDYFGRTVLDSHTTRLHSLIERQIFKDANIHIMDNDDQVVASFGVHKVLIGAFSALLNSAFENTSDVHVPGEYFSREAIAAMLHYVYGMHLPDMTQEMGLEVLNVCQDFKMGSHFRDHIIERMLNLRTKLTFEFALIFYIYGKYCKIYSIRDMALTFFTLNKETLSKKSEYKNFIRENLEILQLLSDWNNGFHELCFMNFVIQYAYMSLF